MNLRGQNCAPFLQRWRNVISMDVCIMASRVPEENNSSIVCTSGPLTAGRSTVGPNTVARFCSDILFSASFSATLNNTVPVTRGLKYSYTRRHKKWEKRVKLYVLLLFSRHTHLAMPTWHGKCLDKMRNFQWLSQ